MGLRVVLPRRISSLDEIVMKLAGYLMKKFEGVILYVEHFEGWDGSNVRIVVSDVGYAEEVIDAVFEFEKKHGIIGTIIPEIVSEEDYKIIIKDDKPLRLPRGLIDELRVFLRAKFGDIIVHVEEFEGWDGSNVRIVVSDVGYAEEVIDAVFEFEKKHGIIGTIIPEIVSKDEHELR